MKKLVDEKGRLFGKINVLDLLVLLLALVLAAAVYVRFFSAGEATSGAAGGDKFTYVVKITGVRQFTVDALKKGDTLYESDGDACLGTVTDIDVRPAVEKYATADGRYVEAPVPEKFDLYVTVSASGRVSRGQCYADNTAEISANGTLYYCSRYLIGSGTVLSVSPEGAA